MNIKVKYECNNPDCHCGSQGMAHSWIVRNVPTRFQAESWMLKCEDVNRILDSYPVHIPEEGIYRAKTYFPYSAAK